MLNRVVLIGRLTKDPELMYTNSGVANTKFTLAVDRPFTSNGNRETDFIPIVVWRKTAETAAEYLRKGRLTAIEGRLQIRNYENSEGRRIWITEVVADNVRFLESNRDNDRSQGDPNEPAPYRAPGDPFHDDGKPIDISDDDLPF